MAPAVRDLSRPHAARAHALRREALVAIARREAAHRRRRARQRWGLALLVAAGSVAAVFQSCASSRSAGRGADAETPLLAQREPGASNKLNRPRVAGKRADRPETTEPLPDATASTYDSAAESLQALLETMNSRNGEAATAADAAASEPAFEPSLTSNVRTNPRRAVEAAPIPVAADEPDIAADDAAASSRIAAASIAPAPTASAPLLVGPPAPGSESAAATASAASTDTDEPDSTATLSFGAVSLCSRVDGFGRFTPLGMAAAGPVRFLAGRSNAAIVYCELDHFTQAPGADSVGGFTAEFSTSIELFHDDGSRQWRANEAMIRDHTRTRRRDLYLVQRIDLPANLSVGKYNLKITVRDRLAADSTGAECETIIPVEIIADPRLLAEPGRPVVRPVAQAPVAGPEPIR